jgi:histidyl-tRNA synthetase
METIGGPPTPGIGFGAGIERLLLSIGDRDVPGDGVDVFFALDEGSDRVALAPVLAELRRNGVACDTDYAGRSLRGQLTQAARVGARRVVIVDAAGATVRERGREDVRVGLHGLAATLAGP